MIWDDRIDASIEVRIVREVVSYSRRLDKWSQKSKTSQVVIEDE
jgi:hypothetical protein